MRGALFGTLCLQIFYQDPAFGDCDFKSLIYGDALQEGMKERLVGTCNRET